MDDAPGVVRKVEEKKKKKKKKKKQWQLTEIFIPE